MDSGLGTSETVTNIALHRPGNVLPSGLFRVFYIRCIPLGIHHSLPKFAQHFHNMLHLTWQVNATGFLK